MMANIMIRTAWIKMHPSPSVDADSEPDEYLDGEDQQDVGPYTCLVLEQSLLR